MTFAHPDIDCLIDFDDGSLHTLIIENPSFFFRFLQDIQSQIDGNPGDTVLSKDNTPLSFSKTVELFDHFVSFDLNQKALLTKVVSSLEMVSLSENYYLRTGELMRQLEMFVGDLASEFSCDIVFGKCGFSNILKAMKLEIEDDANTPLERFLNFMELVREFDTEKLFVFVNLRSYFCQGEIEAFSCSAIEHGFSILLIDNHEYPLIENEKRLVIDEDLCEI